MQIEVEVLGHGKKLLNRMSPQAPLDSFIIFHHGLKVDGRIIGNLIGLYF